MDELSSRLSSPRKSFKQMKSVAYALIITDAANYAKCVCASYGSYNSEESDYYDLAILICSNSGQNLFSAKSAWNWISVESVSFCNFESNYIIVEFFSPQAF